MSLFEQNGGGFYAITGIPHFGFQTYDLNHFG